MNWVMKVGVVLTIAAMVTTLISAMFFHCKLLPYAMAMAVSGTLAFTGGAVYECRVHTGIDKEKPV